MHISTNSYIIDTTTNNEIYSLGEIVFSPVVAVKEKKSASSLNKTVYTLLGDPVFYSSPESVQTIPEKDIKILVLQCSFINDIYAEFVDFCDSATKISQKEGKDILHMDINSGILDSVKENEPVLRISSRHRNTCLFSSINNSIVGTLNNLIAISLLNKSDNVNISINKLNDYYGNFDKIIRISKKLLLEANRVKFMMESFGIY